MVFMQQGWNQDLFADGNRLPTRHDLDKISTQIPIVLERVCGHIVTSNTKAIEILGIDGNSPSTQMENFCWEKTVTQTVFLLATPAIL